MNILDVPQSQVDEWLEIDKRSFSRGNKGAWISALGLAKLAGVPPPDWAWHFVLSAVSDWELGDEADLAAALGVTRSGKRGTQKLLAHEGTIFFVANQLIDEQPGRKKGETFWLEVAQKATKMHGCPPIGWEKARKMYRAAKKSRDRKG